MRPDLRRQEYQEDFDGAVSIAEPSVSGHFEMARVDHWVKNAFLFPGLIIALAISPALEISGLVWRLLLGLLAICLVSSSNYVINEVMDAPFDRLHPAKRDRPVPAGRVSVPLAYLQWIALMLAGVGLGLTVSIPFSGTMLVFWIMACVYNIPPMRSKDWPYIDVLSEAVTNPLRLLAGWLIVSTLTFPPVSLLLSYWMIGCYFMTLKRFAEYRYLGDRVRSSGYRRSFGFYTDRRLLVGSMVFGSLAMIFFGVFMARYRLELIFSLPLVLLVMATYMYLSFKGNSPVQHPEKLYREPFLMGAMTLCVATMVLLFFVDIPALHRIFSPTF